MSLLYIRGAIAFQMFDWQEHKLASDFALCLHAGLEKEPMIEITDSSFMAY